MWPAKSERHLRLRKCALVKALWAGETVTDHGFVAVVQTRLYSLPERSPRLLGAALTPPTAWLPGFFTADLITPA